MVIWLQIDHFFSESHFSKNLKIIIFVRAGSVSIDTGSFETWSRKLKNQRKMYLNNVWRSIGTAELIFNKSVQIHKFVENVGAARRDHQGHEGGCEALSSKQ